ncbi:MAG TPA: sodium:solute symporter family protein [Ignisphaera sp.]|nr:sodium:solute symporter family protein [Ignisphaera sp.]
MISLFFIAMLVAYIVIGTSIAMISRKFGVKTTADYFVAGYRLGGFLASMTYAATTYSAFMMVGLVGLAFVTGVASLGFELSYLIATLGLLSLIGPMIWRKARERKWVSPSEMISDLYGSPIVGITTAILYLIALIPYTSAQLKGVGEIFNSVGIGYEVGIIVGLALVLLWTLIAGMWSVATTDAYQGLWMVSAAIVAIIWLSLRLIPSSGLSIDEIFRTLTNTKNGNLLGNTWSFSTFLGFTTPWLFFALTNPQVVQRLYMPRNEKAYKRMIQYFALYGILYTIIVVLIGLLFRAYTIQVLGNSIETILLKNRDAVTPYMLSLAHPLIASFIYVSIVAAAISTANSIVLSVSSSIARDLYERRLRNPNPKVSIIISSLSIAIMTIIAAIIAIIKPTFIVELSVLSSAMLIPLAPVTIIGILKTPGRKGVLPALCSIVLGFAIVFGTAIVYGAKKALVTTWAGIPVSMWSLIVSTLILATLFIRKTK